MSTIVRHGIPVGPAASATPHAPVAERGQWIWLALVALLVASMVVGLGVTHAATHADMGGSAELPVASE